MSFADALVENRVPPRLGDVRLRYDGGHLVGESLPAAAGQRMLPGLCLLLAAFCAVGGVALLLARPEGTLPFTVLGGMAVCLVGGALHLEARLGRRRFVLHFLGKTLRLERLSWAPGATHTQTIRFDDVTAVEVVQRASRCYALLVVWRTRPEQEVPWRAVLVEQVRPDETEMLYRVWRLLHNAFGLKGAGLAGD